MLFKSGDNLWSGALDFISESEEVSLFSAYIRTEQLKELNKEGKIKRIVVRWEIRDLHQKASDLKLYNYCKENDIALYRNTRIHLKCLINEKEQVLLGSANITGRGIGEQANIFNFELNSFHKITDFSDVLYLEKIVSKSEYVTEELFQEIKKKLESLEDFKKQEEEYKKVHVETERRESDYFLISELPMFKNVAFLHEAANNLESLDTQSKKCVIHDLATYDLDPSQSPEEFYSKLRLTFNNHPFIIGLKNEVKKDSRHSMGYGNIVEWIKKNTTTVPTPISWKMKEEQVVNIFFEWLCYFNKDYVVERPNYRQVLFYRPLN